MVWVELRAGRRRNRESPSTSGSLIWWQVSHPTRGHGGHTLTLTTVRKAKQERGESKPDHWHNVWKMSEMMVAECWPGWDSPGVMLCWPVSQLSLTARLWPRPRHLTCKQPSANNGHWIISDVVLPFQFYSLRKRFRLFELWNKDRSGLLLLKYIHSVSTWILITAAKTFTHKSCYHCRILLQSAASSSAVTGLFCIFPQKYCFLVWFCL